MSEELAGNILAIQTGAPTAVSNAILSGIVTEALNHDVIEEVYGALGGLDGLLGEDFIDLAEESQQTIRGLRYTPCAALGTSHTCLSSEEDVARALKNLETHNIRFVIVIGDAKVLSSLNALCVAAQAKGYALKLIGIPECAENSIGITDHSLGYGSAVKVVATAIKEIAQEQEGSSSKNAVSIIQLDNTQTGWLIAGSTLAKQKNRAEDIPHVLCMPEVRFNANAFLDEVQTVLKKQRYCQIVTSDRVFDADGNYLGTDPVTGEHQPIAQYLASFVQENLGVTPSIFNISSTQRLSGAHISKADNDEGFSCGCHAVKSAVGGKTAKMLTLVRGEGEGYSAEVTYTSLEEISDQPKRFPADWVHENEVTLRHQFNKYGLPLIQGEIELPFENGLPRYVRLSKNKIG